MAPGKEGYDVLRLIEHGQICYVSSEHVYGMTLAQYLRQNPCVEKKQLFLWMQEITRQLELIHRCRGNPSYKYVNPYSIIISKDRKIYFMDVESGTNQEMLRQMRKRKVREYFLPEEERYYQNTSIQLDIYGLGRTLQYLLAHTVPDEKLGRREEIKIQRMISKCLKWQSKKSYQNVSEIRQQIPEYKVKREKLKIRWKLLATAGILIVAVLGKYWFSPGNQEEKTAHTAKEKAELKEEVSEETITVIADNEETEEAYMDLAMAYFLDIGDYEKSLEYLKKAKNKDPCAKDLEVVVLWFSGEKMSEKDKKGYQEHLENLEKNVPEKGAYRYLQCLIRGYQMMNTEKAASHMIRLGNRFLQSDKAKEDDVAEVKEAMITAYETLGQTEKAAEFCEEVLEEETQDEKREGLYKRAVMLYEECGSIDTALDICSRGVKEMNGSTELKLLHIRLLCAEESIGRDICAQTIQSYAEQDPEILESEEFVKLQREYEIQVEGDTIWVGK